MIVRNIFGYDFVIDVPGGKDITILQLSDLQTIELSGIRNDNRYGQIYNAFYTDGITDENIRVWRYVKEAVEKSNPDLIVLIGDNIYGETDEDGSQWLELCKQMDSYKIPWLVIFGNHDNESAKGVRWQLEQIGKTKYGVIKQGNVTGNSNYTVGIRQDGEFKYTMYMLDTNGCKEYPFNPGEGIMSDNPDFKIIQQTQGIYPDQMKWMRESNQKFIEVGIEVPALVFMHIPVSEAKDALRELYPDTCENLPFYADREGDTGVAYEVFYDACYTDGAFWKLSKEIGVTGMFFGHYHEVATSIVYDNIRLSFGLKTSADAGHHRNLLGALAIVLGEADGALSVKYLYSDLVYQTEFHVRSDERATIAKDRE